MKSQHEINRKKIVKQNEAAANNTNDDEENDKLQSKSASTTADATAAAAVSTGQNVKHLYDKIESIKSTVSMVNAERAELWIQRQNLQDLYHQIILSDLDFTIDKKLEQELWNYVFKNQINYFQTQIRENSLPIGGSGGASGVSSGGSSNTMTTSSSSSSIASGSTTVSSSGSTVGQSSHMGVKSKTISLQKKIEAQANMAFFLEAARGFYTKLIEDIVLKYDQYELSKSLNLAYFLSKPMCSVPVRSVQTASLSSSSSSKEEKQILYICQHILTHLGDIARYQNHHDEAKNYYLHAVRLVPYLGQPYNQLGILFETTRTNQLSTVFYYIRSIATRYTFPLASTNLENFFKKLIDLPLTRYSPLITNTDMIGKLVVKLSYMDLITLFLQLNAMIYTKSSKVNNYADLFKSSFGTFVQTALQKDKFDSIQLTQMIAIVMFHLANEQPKQQTDVALDLFVFLVEQFVGMVDESSELVLGPLYVSVSFIEQYRQGSLVRDNLLWKLKKSDNASVEKYVQQTVKLLNEFAAAKKLADDELSEQFPLPEDRLLESYLPLKDAHNKLAFRKYVTTNLPNGDDVNLRKSRIVACFERLLEDQAKECYIRLNKTETGFKFTLSGQFPSTKTVELAESTAKSVSESVNVAQPVRKRRQNVAIASITNENQHQDKLYAKPTPVGGSKFTSGVGQQYQLPTQQQQQQQRYVPQAQSHFQANVYPKAQQQPPQDVPYFPSASIRQFPNVANQQQSFSNFRTGQQLAVPPPLLSSTGNMMSNNGFPSFLPNENFNKIDPAMRMNAPVNNYQMTDSYKWMLNQNSMVQSNPNMYKPVSSNLLNQPSVPVAGMTNDLNPSSSSYDQINKHPNWLTNMFGDNKMPNVRSTGNSMEQSPLWTSRPNDNRPNSTANMLLQSMLQQQQQQQQQQMRGNNSNNADRQSLEFNLNIMNMINLSNSINQNSSSTSAPLLNNPPLPLVQQPPSSMFPPQQPNPFIWNPSEPTGRSKNQ